MHICHDERRNPIDFWSRGSKVKVNFGTLYIKPCGHVSDYSFCPITFKLHMHIRHDERRNPVHFGSRGQMSRSTFAPPCEGMPRLALSSYTFEYFALYKSNTIYHIKTFVLNVSAIHAVFQRPFPSFLILFLLKFLYIKVNFYAPGLKGPPGHLVIGSSVRLSICLSVRLSVRNSVPLSNKVQYLKFGWSYSNQTWTVSSSMGSSHFTDITCPWGWGGVKM